MFRTASAFLLILPICAFSAAPPTQLPKGVAALVNGEPITEALVQYVTRASTPPGFLARMSAEELAAKRIHFIDYLAEKLVIDQKLRTIPGCKIEKAEVDKVIIALEAEYKERGGDFRKMLANANVPEAELRRRIAVGLRFDKFATGKATDKALRELFSKDKEMFDGTKVRARHIQIALEDDSEAALADADLKIREIRKAIQKDTEAGLAKLAADARQEARHKILVEVFAKHAKEKSDCPTKEEGGDRDWFPKVVRPRMAPFANAAFALKVGQMSDVVRTPVSRHLILVTGREPGTEVFDDVKDAVRKVFFDRLEAELAAKLRKKAKILVRAVKDD